MAPLGPSSSALELADGLRRRELSAVELLDACLAAVDERNPELNAVIWRNDGQARAAAEEADRRLAATGSTPSREDAPFLAFPFRSRTSRPSPAGP
jgi:Asp-tRNA(Asn)/Glu-tRNA(Gln) amidotransferase A subunit family amidase